MKLYEKLPFSTKGILGSRRQSDMFPSAVRPIGTGPEHYIATLTGDEVELQRAHTIIIPAAQPKPQQFLRCAVRNVTAKMAWVHYEMPKMDCRRSHGKKSVRRPRRVKTNPLSAIFGREKTSILAGIETMSPRSPVSIRN